MLLAGLTLAALFLSDGLTTDFDFTNNPESKQADTLLEERLRGPKEVIEIVIVRSDTLTVDDPAFRSYVEELYGDVMALGPEVVEAGTNYYQTPDPSLVSADGQATLVPLIMQGDLKEAGGNVGRVHEIVDEAAGREGFAVLITGEAFLTSAVLAVASIVG